MFKIREFSRLCGLSVETLYHYEDIKLLIPARVDKFSGYRYYEAQQLITVNKILALKDTGCSLTEIAQILQKEPSTSILVELLTGKALSLEMQLQAEIRRLERIHTNIFLLKNGGIPVMNEIAIKRVEPILASSVRKSFHKSRFDAELETMWHDVNEIHYEIRRQAHHSLHDDLSHRLMEPGRRRTTGRGSGGTYYIFHIRQ